MLAIIAFVVFFIGFILQVTGSTIHGNLFAPETLLFLGLSLLVLDLIVGVGIKNFWRK